MRSLVPMCSYLCYRPATDLPNETVPAMGALDCSACSHLFQNDRVQQKGKRGKNALDRGQRLIRCCLALQPLERKSIILKVAARLFINLLVIVIDKLLLVLAEETHVNQVPAVGSHGDMLES